MAETAATARQKGISVDITVILDRGDWATRDLIDKAWRLGMVDHVVETDFGDPGLARNHGVTVTKGDLVAFVDLDDLFSTNWLTAAVERWCEGGPKTVIHPEWRLFFGTYWAWQRHPNQSEPEVDLAQQLFFYYWSATFLCHRSVMEKVPYVAIPRASGFGHEDWHWGLEAIAAGYEHLVAPETIRFYRHRPDSVCRQHEADQVLIHQTDFFEQPRPAHSDLYLPITLTARYAAAVPFLQSEWRQAARLEPLLADPNKSMDTVEVIGMPNRPPAVCELYQKASAQYPTGITHVILLPWLRRSGTEVVATNFARAIIESGGTPLVILTEAAEFDAHNLGVDIPIIALGQYHPAELADRIAILSRLIIQKRPVQLLIVESPLGWEMAQRHGQAISQQTKISAVGFMDSILPDGRRASLLRSHLRDTAIYLSKVFIDNHTRQLELERDFGLPSDLFQVLYTPIDRPPQPPKLAATPKPAALWAGRLTDQKRPDRLIAISRQFPNVTFHVWGSVDNQQSNQITKLSQEPNIVYQGPFRDLDSVIKQYSYQAFIYTAEYDGLPVVLLEATQAGLPIITTNAGGVGELISNKTGWIVDQTTGLEAYGQAITDCLNNPQEASARTTHAQALIAKQHSWSAFINCLRAKSTFLIDTRSQT